ncbi:hypothetical protein [Mesorhizobium sp. KR9-304]|uniref:hypothetical protein n=1 Tax=Mesorhizobium sp. KR9-304 TaxID=3156614 RepID=UPI0032B462E0
MLSNMMLLTQLASVWANPVESTSYVTVQSVSDQTTGLTVELGRLVNFSSDCFVVNVFEEQKTDRQVAEAASPIMVACGVAEAEPRLSLENGCYVFSVDHSSGGLRQQTWSDPGSGRSLCFQMTPPGPKGGWQP